MNRKATRRPAAAPENPLLNAVARHQAGDLAGAATLYTALLAAPAQRPDALHYLGLIALAQGDAELARQRIAEAIELLPGRPHFHCNLGNALKRLGRAADAATAYRHALDLAPDFVEARFNLAVLAASAGDDAQAVTLLQEALRQRENFPPAWLALARSLYKLERLDDAVGCYRRTLELRPDERAARLELGSLLLRQGDTRKALAEFRRLTELAPDFVEAWQSLLMAMNYLCLDPQEVFSTHRRVGELLVGVAPRPATRQRPPPGERLRVGILSPDLRRHAMRFFVRPLLAQADRRQVELFAYYSSPTEDAETARFRPLFEHWRDIAGIDDGAALQRIDADGIDVLIDLAGHSANGRMRLLAARAAPLQVTLLGYMNTSGLPTLDVRCTDAVATPAGMEALYTESLLRLPGCQWCYAPDAGAPAVNELPLLQHGRPTLGLFHTPAKFSDEALRCWGRLLAALPTARLLVVLWGETARRLFIDRCRAVGIDAGRIDCRDPLPHDRYLEFYHEVDISLDVFPYAGGTVSCESLWMGVPFVTLAAPWPAGRGGASILTAIGMEECIASREDEYVERAVALLADPPRLAELRRTLRPRLQASPLMDAAAWGGEFWQRIVALAGRAERPTSA